MNNEFFELISRGGQKEIEKLKEIIENDPKDNFYGKTDPKHLLNKKNFLIQTPIYVAAKHGNLKVVEFLLEVGSNPKILSNTSENEQENLLECTARWN